MAISHVKSVTVVDWTGTVTVGNSAGGTQTIAATDLVRPSDYNSVHNQTYTLSGNTNNASTASGTNVVFAASHGVTLDGSTGTIVWRGPRYTNFGPYGFKEMFASTQGQAQLWVNPATFPYVEHDRLVQAVRMSHATNSTGSMTLSAWWGLYTRTGNSISVAYSTSYTQGVTFSGTVNSTLHSGLRFISFGWTNTIPASDYFIGFVSRTTTGGAACSLSNYMMSNLASSLSGPWGSASNQTHQLPFGLGQYSATTSGMPGSIAFSELQGGNRAPQPAFVWFQSQSTT